MIYNVNYLGISEDFKTFYFAINSDKPKVLTVSVYNTFFDNVEYFAKLEVLPNVSYWNYVVTNHQHRYAEFVDDETGDIVGQFTLPGIENYYNRYSSQYVRKIYNLVSENEKEVISSLMNEFTSNKIYVNDFIDIEENDVVVDIGFNYGIFSINCLSKNPKKIVGFEPNTKLCNIFDENFYDDRIRLINIAVSDENKVIKFHENKYSVMNTVKDNLVNDNTQYSYEIHALGINNLIKKYNLDNIDYLKVDCEGSEYEIFESISDDYLTNNVRKIAIEFHDDIHDYKVVKLKHKLITCGFTLFEVYNGGDVGMIYAKKLS